MSVLNEAINKIKLQGMITALEKEGLDISKNKQNLESH